jgi:hypothetical protein
VLGGADWKRLGGTHAMQLREHFDVVLGGVARSPSSSFAR